MRILIVSAVLLGACFAQQQRRPSQPQSQDDYEDQPRQQHNQPQYQPQDQHPKQRSDERTTTFIPIIRFDKEQGSDGSYKAAWETGNNILAQEEGFLKELGPDPDAEGQVLNAQVQQGSYTYTAPDGQIITVNYVADEKGFHPTGDHLPTPPPVSPEVQKGLDLIYAGIKAQQEADALEAKQNPQGAERNEVPRDYNGQYRP